MHTIKDVVKQLIGKSLDAYNTKYTKVLNTRIDNIVAQAGNDNTEIVDARIDSAGVTHTTLNNRILAETKMNDEQLVEYTGSNISAEDTTQGYLKDVEILGNTIQNEEDLADIKSVGKLQEDGTYKMSILSCGKNVWNVPISLFNNDKYIQTSNYSKNSCISLPQNSSWTLTFEKKPNDARLYIWKGDVLSRTIGLGSTGLNQTFTLVDNEDGISFYAGNFGSSPYDIMTVDFKIQLEEGTQATSYEPYQENKCDILLPCQLEKVGDVSDRLYYDDVEKAWCIEKNIVDFSKIPKNWSTRTNDSGLLTFECNISKPYGDVNGNKLQIICSKLVGKDYNTIYNNPSIEGIGVKNYDTNLVVRINISASKLISQDMNGLVDYLEDATFKTFYYDTTPQKIVLPLSIQIALNSFFGTTHVYMESGEVEGTIKCKIPKSLGATVQSLNNKTDILSDRVTAIEGLKDSQNMKYETDKGYLVCKETKNGVIDDLKIEGKTLVNLCPKYVKNSDLWVNKTFESDSDGFVTVNANGTWVACPRLKMSSTNIKPNTVYTIILEVKSNTLVSSDNNGLEFSSTSFSEFAFKWNKVIKPKETGTFVHKITSLTNLEGVWELFRTQIYNTCTEGSIVYRWYLLEGDHTQNPPSYFEGLMSVGQDVDKIEVLSSKGFELDGELEQGGLSDSGLNTPNSNRLRSKNYSRVLENKKYKISTDDGYYLAVSFYTTDDFTTPRIGVIGWSGSNELEFTTPKGTRFIRINVKYKTDTTLYASSTKVTTEYKGDKKQILFYNENGELEPVQELHEWDSIEKHSDNKWYYHKRSGKVVLNGNEDWLLKQVNTNCTVFALRGTQLQNKIKLSPQGVSDKFAWESVLGLSTEVECIGGHSVDVNTIRIAVAKSKLSTQDVQGFKQWLQANNVTVVYQLAEEEVYEIAPLHLDSYANETLILCNSGAISPKMEFSITSHINELVKAYGERINLLEEKVYQYMVAQNRLQLASTYSADSVTFKVDYFSLCGDEENYNEDLYNLILNNILVGKDNYDYDKMFTMILDYASWNQISWEQFDILVGLMDIQHNPPVEELPTEDEIEEDIIEEDIIEEDIIENEETPVE